MVIFTIVLIRTVNSSKSHTDEQASEGSSNNDTPATVYKKTAEANLFAIQKRIEELAANFTDRIIKADCYEIAEHQKALIISEFSAHTEASCMKLMKVNYKNLYSKNKYEEIISKLINMTNRIQDSPALMESRIMMYFSVMAKEIKPVGIPALSNNQDVSIITAANYLFDCLLYICINGEAAPVDFCGQPVVCTRFQRATFNRISKEFLEEQFYFKQAVIESTFENFCKCPSDNEASDAVSELSDSSATQLLEARDAAPVEKKHFEKYKLMYIVIWFGCLLVHSLITTVLVMSGIEIGAILSIVLLALTIFAAKKLCEQWHIYIINKSKSSNDTTPIPDNDTVNTKSLS